MARRVFEIAKELGVTSKAIVTKCHAEGVPQDIVKNHMSSISAGLEATVREWFAGGDEGGGTATAVETSEKVDISKVRAKPRAKAKAKAKAASASAPPADADSNTPAAPAGSPASGSAAASPEGDADRGKDAAAGTAEADTPDSPAVEPGRDSDPGQDTETSGSGEPGRRYSFSAEGALDTGATPADGNAAASTHADPRPQPAGEPAASTPGDQAEDAAKPTGGAPSSHAGSAPPAPPAPEPVKPAAMNVPTRPKVVAPAGPMLNDQERSTIKLSGPKVVRVEAPETLDVPRRGPRRRESRLRDQFRLENYSNSYLMY
ncbi:MAG: hypothetical protein AAGF47_11210 [Planctomycetota bacterium]